MAQRRAGFLVLLAGVLVLAGMVGRASAFDPMECGAMACEAQAAAANHWIIGPGVGCHPTKGGECVMGKDRDPPILGGYAEAWVYQCWQRNQPDYRTTFGAWKDACACSTLPNEGHGEHRMTNNSDGKYCKAGCEFGPNKGSSCAYAPVEDKFVCWSYGADGEPGSHWRPTGEQCNPVNPPAPDQPGPPEACTPMKDGSEGCIGAPQPPENDKPQACMRRGDGNVFCVPLPEDSCASTAEGSICAGSPPPRPPKPEPPAVQPPPLEPAPPAPPPQVCMDVEDGSQHCIRIDFYPPPTTPPPPPKCPDGSNPVDGKCPAPPANCPDGTRPVNGKCPARDDGPPREDDPPGSGNGQGGELDPGEDGTCPEGHQSQGGRCFKKCPDGSISLDGWCPAPVGACPNGRPPVDGWCSQGDPGPGGDGGEPGGDGDEEGDGRAGGGETCRAAPYCAGDPILCEILHQQWRTRCNLEATGEAGDDDWTEPGESDYGDPEETPDVWGEPEEIGESWFDMGGFLGGSRECPAFPTVHYMDHTLDLSDMLPCGQLAILARLILIGGLVQGAFIVMKR